jgi:hypothetical protein
MVKAPVFQSGDFGVRRSANAQSSRAQSNAGTEQVVQTAEFSPQLNDTITNNKGGDFIVWLPTSFNSYRPRYSSHN